ncbi:glycosyltransferase family 2 protein [Pirellulaceae bacterium SH467]
MLLSVVLPVYNEQAVLPALIDHLLPVLDSIREPTGQPIDYELIFVDDGSRDETPHLLRYYGDLFPQIRILQFSRNFGQQAAITAGLDVAQGDAVLVMDADLQDPPALIPAMLSKLLEGFDVVSTRKTTREGETLRKRWTATAFYKLMQRTVDERLPAEVGDFRLFSRGAVEAIRAFREQHRFMRGLVAWLGLRECVLPFERPARAAGETKYSTLKLMQLAWTAISSFSALPLKLSLYGGMLLTTLGIVYSFYAVYVALFVSTTAPGWSSLICFQLLFNGATLMAVGLVGDYVGRIFEESKRRPLYVVAETTNCTELPHAPRSVYLHRAAPYHCVSPSDSVPMQRRPLAGLAQNNTERVTRPTKGSSHQRDAA